LSFENFYSMGLKTDLLQMIDEKGFEKPTPIQVKSIPIAMAGLDLMGQAQTGTGKTASFGIPILNRVIKGEGLQALVLCPTRELAVQVTEEISSLSRRMRIQVLAIYGGQSIELQLRSLRRKPEIIVGTPGRLMDHMNRGTISLSPLKYVVMDEADEMLDMGFLPDIQKILSQCPRERQTFLFSATLPDEVRELGTKFMKQPEIILIESPERTVPEIEQYYYQVNSRRKIETLCRIIDAQQPPISLIFCRTKRNADELARVLTSRGYNADALHGDMSQRERDHVMHGFRQGNTKILVATDLAARGLDIELVTHVFNFDIPEDLDSYIHRVGRTGRAGRSGIAITLVEPTQIRLLRMIERHTGKRIERALLPTLAEAVEKRQDLLLERVRQASAEPGDVCLSLAEKLMQQGDPEKMLAAALKLLIDEEPDFEMAELPESDDSMAHLELPAGRLQGIHPRQLLEFIATHTSLSPQRVGDIEINRNSTFVEVPMDYIHEVYEAFEKYRRTQKNKTRPARFPKENRKIMVNHGGR